MNSFHKYLKRNKKDIYKDDLIKTTLVHYFHQMRMDWLFRFRNYRLGEDVLTGYFMLILL